MRCCAGCSTCCARDASGGHCPAICPKWRTVHSYFAKWSEPGKDVASLLQRALVKQVEAARQRLGRDACTKFLIVDAQSLKNADTAGLKGYDGGKKISGIKRHIAVDTQGLPHAVAVSTAEVTDRLGALQAFQRCKSSLGLVQSVLADGGYGWRQLPWPADDNYLGRFDAIAGRDLEAGYCEPIELQRRLTFCPARR